MGPETTALDTKTEPTRAADPGPTSLESATEAPSEAGQAGSEPPPTEPSEQPTEVAERDSREAPTPVGPEGAGSSLDVMAPPSTGGDTAAEPAIEGDDDEEIEYPDYIFGPGPEETGSEDPPAARVQETAPEAAGSALEEPEQPADDVQKTSRIAAVEDLARDARDLMDGPLGPQLRELMVRLEGLPTSEAVARAFTAGYRQGQIREES